MEQENTSKIYSSLSLLCFNLFIASLLVVVCSYFSVLVLDIIFNPDIIFGAGMFLGFLALVFWEKSKGKWNIEFHLPKNKKKVEKVVEKDDNLFFRVVPYLFLLMLLVIAVNQFFKWDFVNAQMMRIAILAITFGAITFWRNRERVEKEIEQEKEDEGQAEIKRESEFDKKFKRLRWFNFNYGIKDAWLDEKYFVSILKALASPFVWFARLPYSFVKWIYKEGWGYVIALIFILIFFTVIKAPYWELSFTGEHSIKYGSFVEPAKYMFENNNPFWYQLKYQAEPLNNPQGIFSTFGNFPLMDWGLFLTYNAFPFNSLEVNTRLFTHFLGILILFFGYLFFTKWFTKKQALIITFLMAINPIINFISFVTVEDSWLIILTFITLIYLSSYIKKGKFSDLFYAGLFFGIGFSVKYSILLWLFPIIFILLLSKSRNLNYLIKSLGIMGALSLLPTMVFSTSLRYLPTNVTLSVMSFIVWIVLLYIFYTFIIKKEKIIDIFINKLIAHKLLLIGAILLTILLSLFFIFVTKMNLLFNGFLTDSNLIFNWSMYKFMFEEQFKPYITSSAFYLGIIGFLFTLFLGLKKQRVVLLAFFIGSLFYWIMASKVIFFHNYYTAIIMLTFCFSISILIYSISVSFNIRFIRMFLILLFGLLVISASIHSNTERLNKESDSNLIEVAKYLSENSLSEELFIRPGTIHSPTNILSLYSDRASFSPESLLNFKNNSLSSYHIRYILIYDGDNFNFLNLVINSENLSYVYEKIDRSEIILNRLDGMNENNINVLSIGPYYIEDQLKFIKTINGIKIYEVK